MFLKFIWANKHGYDTVVFWRESTDEKDITEITL